jgi:drug/metabolite transporter (DMT)-like permease
MLTQIKVIKSKKESNSKTRWGYYFAAANAVISGFAIFINSYGVKMFPDSAVYTTLKNGVVGLALLIPLALLAGPRHEFKHLKKRQWAWLGLLALVGGSLPYLLFFQGLQMTTAVTGSVLNHTQFLIVALLAIFLLQERFGPMMWLALAALMIGSTLGSNLNALRWDAGALLVLISTFLFAGGVILAKYLLAELSTLTVMVARMSFGSVLLLIYLLVSGKLDVITRLSLDQWGFVLLTGLTLLAFTVTAFLALRYTSATVATAIPTASPIITTLLVALTGGQLKVGLADGLGLAVMLVAVVIIYMAGHRREMLKPGEAAA